MKDQMLIDKYNELGKAHIETVNRLLKKDELIKELMGALESSNMEINDWHMGEDSHCNWNNMLIEKAKKLVGEK